MSDLVRVRLERGDEVIDINVGAAFAEARKLHVLEDEPTHSPDGQPLPERRTRRRSGRPSKPQVHLSPPAGDKTAALPAETAKEA